MTTAQFFIPYMINFSIGLMSGIVLKRRLKLLYPSIHSRITAPSVAENNIKISLENLKFMLLHKQWKSISETPLLVLLHIQRVSWILMITALAAFPLLAWNGVFNA